MKMSTINVRIDNDLKERGDKVFPEVGVSITQAITELYQYYAQNGKSPFVESKRIATVRDIAVRCYDDFTGIRDTFILLKFNAERLPPVEQLLSLYQATVFKRRMLLDNLCWLHSENVLPKTITEVLPLFSEAQRLILECDSILCCVLRTNSDLPCETLSALTGKVRELDIAVNEMGNAIDQLDLRPRIKKLDETLFRGEFFTVTTENDCLPGSIRATVWMHSERIKLLMPFFKEPIQCPEFMGWNAGYRDKKYAAMLIVTANPGSKAARFSNEIGVPAMQFIDGKTEIFYSLPFSNKADHLPKEKIAEDLCTFLDMKACEALKNSHASK